VTPDELHLDRARAESFGSVAEQYDRHRPTVPDALIDELAAARPARVVDIGCGTGKVAVALAERGLPVLGVELDERMAEVARGHGIPVEVAAFETWHGAGRQFDLITCGDAWHWIDPDAGIAKVAELLRPGGTIARLWNYQVLDEPVTAAFEAIYREHAPAAHAHVRLLDENGYLDPFAHNDAFAAVEVKTYRRQRTLTADAWVALVTTFSDHQRLEPERLAAVQQALRATIGTFGGTIRVHSATLVRLARRV
jgi:SAM-dependent methyltransferase